ncbi:dioxygenase [Actinomadura rubrisoli]|uniref:Dioxygenase n=1 Tax=Actinomadura rubrisoli TaxID=2530368 RepID=A0A4R5A461_9ACTN|nr:dioxygenase [Actinomadura rubrisoli]TDD66748.1 dioxygenase [Actinomadura rubrisoli]
MPEDEQEQGGISRKNFIAAVGIGALAVPAVVSSASPAQATQPSGSPLGPRLLEPTPKCTDGDDEQTPNQTEGPYFKPGSPERANLVTPGMPGTKLTVSGIVYSRSCKPIARALLDFWQCDNGGIYDNSGYTLRGHQYTDAAGKFTLQTIVPGLYPGRTRHIHVKAQAPGQRILTTQLYFPGEPRNQTDTIYDPRLLMKMGTDQNGRTGAFDFVLMVP